MVLGILLPCNMTWADDDITPFLPVFTPEEQAEMARGRAANPPTPPAVPNPELERAVSAATTLDKDGVREADLGVQMVRLVCDSVKTDAAHATVGYRFVEDRARACVDDVNLSRNLGIAAPEGGVVGNKSVSSDQRAYLACMARECESRVLMRLFAAGK